MKTLRKIRTTVDVPNEMELYDLRLDNLVRIENQSSGVMIRAARDGLCDAAKDAFVRYLATEGFIAERFRPASENPSLAGAGIEWVTDGSWVRFNHRRIRMATRVWAYLTWGRWLSLALFLVALAAAIWLKRH